VNRVTIRGFLVSDHVDRMLPFLADTAGWLRAGRVKYREDVVEGLDRAPPRSSACSEARTSERSS